MVWAPSQEDIISSLHKKVMVEHFMVLILVKKLKRTPPFLITRARRSKYTTNLFFCFVKNTGKKISLFGVIRNDERDKSIKRYHSSNGL